MPLHTLLRRQVKRHLDSVDTTAKPWRSFLEAVNDAYRGFDSDRAMLERVMELSSNELLEASSELRAIMSAFPDVVLHLDAQGTIVGCRGASDDGFWAPGRVLQRPLADVVPPEMRGAVTEVLATILQQRIVASLELSGGPDDVVVYEMRLTPLGGSGMLGLVRNVTERRRGDQLRVAKEAAEAANRAKSAFLANMSHELRTPLNAVIGYSEMLQEDAETAALISFRDDLGRIEDAGRHLLEIVNSILDVAKIEAGRMEVDIEPVALDPLIAQVVDSVRPVAYANHDELHVSISPEVAILRTDAIKLRQVLVNLVGNACKFTSHGTVRLDVAGAANAREIAFIIRDNGIGIPGEKLPLLFQDFMQVDESTTRRYGGTGLGLAISQRLCRLLGGRIEVTSTVGEGSTFTVYLPTTHGRASAHARGNNAPRVYEVVS